jgi:ribose transport system substrate-binding protein
MLWRKGLTAAALAALAIGAAACGSGSDDNADTGSASSTGAATEAAAPATTAEAAPTATTPDIPGAAKFEEAVPGSGDGVKIGYISLGDQVPFVKLVSDDIRKQAETAGAHLVFCDSQLDAAKALDCAKNFKTQNVDVIINFQVDEKSAPRICAAGPDVPTIAIDINQKPCQVTFMGANNKFAGEIAGKAMGDYAKEKFSCEYDAVVSMQQPAAGIVNTDRSGGMLDAFEKICGKSKNLKVVDGGGTIEGGQKKFADVLTSLPGKHRIIVMSLNDDMSLGSLAAAKAQGRTKDLYIAGQGADPTAYCQIKTNPQWIGDAAYFPEKYGQIAIPAAIKAAKGETLPPKLLVPHVFINKDNIEQYYQPTGC